VSGPCHFVIFGATGHLTSTKLLPSLYQLELAGRLGEALGFVAVARRDWTAEQWRGEVLEKLADELGDDLDDGIAARFAGRFAFVGGDYQDPDTYKRLLEEISKPRPGLCENVVFYLAIPPRDFTAVVRGLDSAGLASVAGRHRIVLEKPFGSDLASAGDLNAELHRHYREDQIFRIDHYLGKETVQNLLVFRFANSIIEPLWNRNHIDHVQITVAEDAGIGSRAGYFDGTGVLRDMIQNHLLQVLTLVAMEPPASLDADSLRDEKVKVLKSIRPIKADQVQASAVRARYGAGNGTPAYADEPGVADDSLTETYAALRLHVDNWRWRGVPFYLRSGKRLTARRSMVAIRFREPPHQIFDHTPCQEIDPNWLLLAIQPEENIRLELYARQPGLSMTPRVLQVQTDFRSSGEQKLDAYATLLLDVIRGDRSLFIRFDEVEAAWRVIDPVLSAWSSAEPPLYEYAPGSWGPVESAQLFQEPKHRWRNEL